MPLLDSALRCAGRGWPVFPIVPGGKTPAIPAAHPDGDPQRGVCRGECGRAGHGLNDATTDATAITAWWTAMPAANLGISAGPAGLVVIDLDTASGPRPELVLREQDPDEETPRGVRSSWTNLRWLAHRRGGQLADLDTLTVVTPSGGRHLYFTRPAGITITSGAGMRSGLGWLIDVRAAGGYVVAPPSTRPDGVYRVAVRAPVREVPVWLLDALADAGRVPSRLPRRSAIASQRPVPDLTSSTDPRRHAYLSKAVASELQAVMDAEQGQRNECLNRSAFSLGQLVAGAGLDEAAVTDALIAAAEAAGLSEHEAASTIRSGLSAGARTPRSANA